MTISSVENIIRVHPAIFSEIFYERSVYNSYFDSTNLDNYYSNVDGNTKRTKVRIRWYDLQSGEVLNPTLELKIKEGLLGTKKSYALNKFTVHKTIDTDNLTQVIQSSNIPPIVREMLNGLKPTLINTYIRKYFLSADKRFRITIDRNQKYFHSGLLGGFQTGCIKNDKSIILELKYDQSSDDSANSISSQFPFRLTKYSKYVSGIENLYR
jgi:hypothetical protein